MLKSTVKSLSTILVIILSVALFCSFSAGCVKDDKKVILISIDGLRADVIENTEYGRYLMQNHAYTLEVTTVNPSITLPCHTSMFYSVTPNEHGIIANTYTPSENLGDGIIEVLSKENKTTAMFYNWYEISYLDRGSVADVNTFISGYDEGWEEANASLGELCKEHIL